MQSTKKTLLSISKTHYGLEVPVTHCIIWQSNYYGNQWAFMDMWFDEMRYLCLSV